MKTVSQAVEEVIERSPFLLEAMSEGIANNAQIARRIRPEVEKKLYEEVSEAAVAMALHRMNKSVQRPRYGAKFLKHMSDITVRSNLVEFSFPNSPYALLALDVISKRAQKGADTFFNLSRGVREVAVIVSQELAEDVLAALQNIPSVHRTEHLSAITMHLPDASLTVPGVYHLILNAVAMEGISLVEVISVRAEFTILLADKDVDRAFSVLKRITS
ncbi:MAG TPA: hypothetical protein VN495_01170 [Candidatus Paceibacterota bacterium]|nr:hypothetical protein [Candidatus Paceibacterota bacterium]